MSYPRSSCLLISTHSLTRRLTETLDKQVRIIVISTHSLTRRLTINEGGVI